MLAAQVHAARVHRLHALPCLEAGLEDRGVVGGGDAGVVVEHVDAAEALDCGCVQRLHRRLVRDVHLHREAADLAGDLLRGGAVDVGNRDLRALFGEAGSRVGAHPAAGARDHAHLALEPTGHQSSVE